MARTTTTSRSSSGRGSTRSSSSASSIGSRAGAAAARVRSTRSCGTTSGGRVVSSTSTTTPRSPRRSRRARTPSSRTGNWRSKLRKLSSTARRAWRRRSGRPRRTRPATRRSRGASPRRTARAGPARRPRGSARRSRRTARRRRRRVGRRRSPVCSTSSRTSAIVHPDWLAANAKGTSTSPGVRREPALDAGQAFVQPLRGVVAARLRPDGQTVFPRHRRGEHRRDLPQGLDPKRRAGQAHGPGEYFAGAGHSQISVAYCKGGRKMIVFAVLVDRSGLTCDKGCPLSWLISRNTSCRSSC